MFIGQRIETNNNKCDHFLYENNSDTGIVILTYKSNLSEILLPNVFYIIRLFAN